VRAKEGEGGVAEAHEVGPRSLTPGGGAAGARVEARLNSTSHPFLLGLTLTLLTSSACSCQGVFPDGGVPDAGAPDGGDAGPTDAGPADAGPFDAGAPDAGTPDSGHSDAGPHDAGVLPDAGSLRCFEVACVGDSTCTLEDGECRCNGTPCQLGQTCTCPQGMPGCQPNQRVCDVSTRCDGVTCMGGATCDPADGLCKCGGAGGPACSSTQLCGAARPAQCVGGCASTCEHGMSCDADDGTCKCGGHGGAPCATGELCVSTSTAYACRLACSPPIGPCPGGQSCFIDTRPTLTVAYCTFPSAQLSEGEPCALPTQCFDAHPLHCAGLSSAVPVGTCREGCDPSAPQCATGRHCAAVADVPDAGLCVP
jgi:hypothetical protein